jgi:hypothetical protein
MSQALGGLGIRTAHLGKIFGHSGVEHHDSQRLARMLHQIQNEDYRLDVLEECQGLADYPACCMQVIERLDEQYPGSLFINVQRQDLARWLQSVELQFVGLDLIAEASPAGSPERQLMKIMHSFRQMTFGNSQFQATQYRQAYQLYQQQVQAYFSLRSSDWLNFEDVSQLASDGFKRLGKFLNLALNKEAEFPSSNLHSQIPKQAFMTALRSGTTQSQTGLIAQE